MDKVSYNQALAVASSFFKDSFNPVQIGRNNWVFESGDSILTVPRHERVRSYDLRVAASKSLASHGLPVPEILDYSPAKLGCPEYLVVRKIRGTHIDLAHASSRETSIVHGSAGEILASIHKIPVEGWGRLTKDMVGQNPSWSDFVDQFFTESIRRVGLSPHLSNYLYLLKREYGVARAVIESCHTPSFLHGDFHLGNLLFHQGKVAAVLDLDIVTGGCPSWDIGHYMHTFNFDRKLGVEAFRRGYGGDMDKEAERLYSLVIWTRKIGSQAIDRPDALKETIPELEKILGRIEG